MVALKRPEYSLSVWNTYSFDQSVLKVLSGDSQNLAEQIFTSILRTVNVVAPVNPQPELGNVFLSAQVIRLQGMF